MSASDHAPVARIRALAEELKRALETFAAQEETLERQHRSRQTSAQRRHEQSLQEAREAYTARRQNTLASQAQARRRAVEAFNHREQRLIQARARIAQTLSIEVEKKRGARVLRLQHDELQKARCLQQRHDDLATLRLELRRHTRALQQTAAQTRASFPGLWWLQRFFILSKQTPAADAAEDASATTLFQQAKDSRQTAAEATRTYRRAHPAVWMGLLASPWLWLAWAGVLAVGVWLSQTTAVRSLPLPSTWRFALVWWAAVVVPSLLLHLGLARYFRADAHTLATPLQTAHHLHQTAVVAMEQEEAALNRELAARNDQQAVTDAHWDDMQAEAAQALAEGQARLQEKWIRAAARSEALHARKMRTMDAAHPQELRRLQEEGDAIWEQLKADSAAEQEQIDQDYQAQWQDLVAAWQAQVPALWDEMRQLQETAAAWFPEWTPSALKYQPRAAFTTAARVGTLELNLSQFATALPRDPRLQWPGPSVFSLPLTLLFPRAGSLVLEAGPAGREIALGALNSLIFRLLATVPPGLLNFTLIDPVGLGSSFAGLTHLADYEGGLVNNRVWTRREQIEQRLNDLSEHVEKVIQMYLRDEHETIAEYNQAAGSIAERSHFVVIADFPSGFSEAALKQLHHLATSGPRCGVHLFIHWDPRLEMPELPVFEDLRAHITRVCATPTGEFVLANGSSSAPAPLPGAHMRLDQSPEGLAATEFIHHIGRTSRDASRVEVPFDHVAPPEDALWTEATTDEIRVPIGRTGASKWQYLALGKGTRQHALLAGKTGSGKSNLFHVIITNLALRCSPEEIEFYLVDFKKGVEFKCYATHRLPHARVVAIESDREFGLSVLQRLDEELRRRGELFRRAGVQDMVGWRKTGSTPLPRTLLAIDEFQEFFTEDDRTAQAAAVLLDRLVRQGRAFGLHVLLGSQTLGGAYSLARATLGQMTVRIALQCNEADALLIMDDGNSAARLLSRPGEGIYNDAAGALEANSPFQAVYLPEDIRDEALGKIAAHAALHPPTTLAAPVVFEGNLPADIRENTALHDLLHHPPSTAVTESHFWLGAPNAIKGPTAATLRRQSGNHLLFVGQNDEAILTLFCAGLIALAAQHPGHDAASTRLLLLDASAPGTPERAAFETLVHALPRIEWVRGGEAAATITALTSELKRRSTQATESDPPFFVFIHQLSRHKKLRYDDELAYASDAARHPAMQFDHLLKEGAAHGIHVIASVDTVSNLHRFLSRKAVAEFEQRVLFQMSANDSASLVDTTAAGSLGLHRALFHHEHEGYQEVFRPYGPPPVGWLEEAAYRLRHTGVRRPSDPFAPPTTG